MTIPKIIHHIGPKDRSTWHPIWTRCYPSWKEQFPDFEFRLWNDEEDIDNLVAHCYPEYLDLYKSFQTHIMRIDFARLCILHQYGGFYADLDVYCYKNFYDELRGDLFILEAPYGDTFTENALMISSQGHEFWNICMEECRNRFNENVNKYHIESFTKNRALQYIITHATGPFLISDVYKKTQMGHILPGIVFNNHGLSYHPEYRTKHLLTGIWGKEAIQEVRENEVSYNDLYISEVSKYADLQGITVENFDFYHDYTNGGYLTQSSQTPENEEREFNYG